MTSEGPRPAGVVQRLDAYQRRHPAVAQTIAVAYKFVDDQGGYLTALLTYYGFLSLFPLLLLLVTILGYLLQGSPELQQDIVNSAVSRFPVLGDQIAGNVQSLQGNPLALVAGIGFSLYGGLGVAQAGQMALNRIWGVPRNARPNPLLARLRSLVLLFALVVGVLVTTALSAITAMADSLVPGKGPGVGIFAQLGAILISTGVLLLAFRLLTARQIPVRDLWMGALGAAIVGQALQLVGTYYVSTALEGATATYGAFGLVLGLISWIYLGALTVVVAAEVNAVRARRMWPRSLLTPFTDDVDLTRADERAYASYAQSERHKSFQTVDVQFERPEGGDAPPPASPPAGRPD